MYEIELYYPATPDDDAHMVVVQVDASCYTELANIAYGLQMRSGYRTKKDMNGKITIQGLQVEYVSFGPVIERDESGLPAYGSKKN